MASINLISRLKKQCFVSKNNVLFQKTILCVLRGFQRFILMCFFTFEAYIFKTAKKVYINLLEYNNDLFQLDFKTRKYGFFTIKPTFCVIRASNWIVSSFHIISYASIFKMGKKYRLLNPIPAGLWKDVKCRGQGHYGP